MPAVRERIAIVAIALRTERRDIALSTLVPGSIAIRQLSIARRVCDTTSAEGENRDNEVGYWLTRRAATLTTIAYARAAGREGAHRALP